MVRPPHIERAVLDLRKLESYCLNPRHPRGRHKARLFRDVLDLGSADAEWLKDILLKSLADREAVAAGSDAFGDRWRVDIPVARQGRRGVIRTIWMARTGENILRFVTCWVL
jgi:hypothetical protein